VNWKYNKLTWLLRQSLWPLGLDICSYINLRALLAECDLVIDAGANRGDTYDYFRRFGYRGPFVCFEPSPGPFAKLLKKRTVSCTKLNICLSDRPGPMTFYMRGGDGCGDGLHRSATASKTIQIQSARLDSFAANYQNFKRIFLKIDTEGHDLVVMRGASDILGQIRYVMMEVPVFRRFDDEAVLIEVINEMHRLGFSVSNFVGNIFEATRKRSQAFDLIFESHSQVFANSISPLTRAEEQAGESSLCGKSSL
jgi:FkbM family methyltransferase